MYGTKSISKTCTIFRNPTYAEAIGATEVVPPDTQAPQIRDIRIENITAEGYDVSCVVTDDTEVASVKTETWHTLVSTDSETSGEMKCKDASLSNGRYSVHINRAEHDGKYGYYQTNIIAADPAGNQSKVYAGTAMVGTYADIYKDGFFCEVLETTPVGFTYAYGISTLPTDTLKVVKNTGVRVWSEEAGEDFQGSQDDHTFANFVARDGGMRTGGSGETTYTTVYVICGVSDKIYGYHKGKYHMEYSVLFSDGSVINNHETVELSNPGVPMKEMEWNGHTYKLFFDNLTWEEAEQACESMGGHLVTITSEEEMNALTDRDSEDSLVNYVNCNGIVSGTFRDFYYTGGAIDPTTGEVSWVTGEKSDYTAWENGDEGINSEDHILMLKDSTPSAGYKFGIWKWSNVAADAYKCGYICEIDGLDSRNRLKLNETELTLKPGDSRELSAVRFPEYRPEAITLISSDPTIVSVDGASLTALKAGEATVTAWDEEGALRAECKVTVEKTPVTSVALDKRNVELQVGRSTRLIPRISPADATEQEVIYSSDAETVATVSEDGTVVARAEGTAVITVTSVDSAQIKANCIITVKAADPKNVAVSSVSLNRESLHLVKGESAKLETVIMPANATNKAVLWSSLAPSVATVDENGVVRALKAGETTIRVWTEDEGFSAECHVVISNPARRINISNRSLLMSVGESEVLYASVIPEDAQDSQVMYEIVSQEPENKNHLVIRLVTREDGGVAINAVSAGTALVRAKAGDGAEELTGDCLIYVSDATADTVNNEVAAKEGLWIDGISEDGYSYTGSAVKPEVYVYYGDQMLRAGTEYSISYKNNVKVGKTAQIIVTGKGQYSGKHAETFAIKPCSLKEDNEQVSIYAIKTAKGVQTMVTASGKTLKAVRDYDITDAGDGKLTINGFGNYCDSRTVSVRESAPIQIKKVSVTLPKSVTYTGEEITLTDDELKVTEVDGIRLINGKDYTVTYESNRNVGTAVIYITGLADGEGQDYTGTVKKTFKILPAQFTDSNTQMYVSDRAAYAKGGAKPVTELIWTCESTGKKWILREGTDYKLTFKNNGKIGSDATMSVVGIGCFKGSKLSAYTFTVTAQDISKLYAYAPDKSFNAKKKGNYYMSAPVIYDLDGKKLAVRKDYTVTYYNQSKGEVLDKTSTVSAGDELQAIVTGVNAYAGSTVKIKYRAVAQEKNISKAKTGKIPAAEYTGSMIELDDFPTVTFGKNEVLGENDNGYEVVAYFNNRNKGTASVLIAGTGDYSGCKLITFKIAAQKWK